MVTPSPLDGVHLPILFLGRFSHPYSCFYVINGHVSRYKPMCDHLSLVIDCYSERVDSVRELLSKGDFWCEAYIIQHTFQRKGVSVSILVECRVPWIGVSWELTYFDYYPRQTEVFSYNSTCSKLT